MHAISKSLFYDLPNNCKDQIMRSEWQIAMIEIFENDLWYERLKPGETRAVTQADE